MNKHTGKTHYAAKQLADNSLDIYIYDDIECDTVDWFWGDTIESDTSAKHIKKLLDNNKTASQINVYINSYGGDVNEAVAIKSQLTRHPAHTTAYIDSACYSAACDIALSCDEVIMYKGSSMMLHHASWGVYGNPAQLRKSADDLEVLDKASCSTYMRKGIKITQEELNAIIDGSDGTGTFLTAEDCLEKGLCDKIADEEENIDTIKQQYNASVQQHLDMLITQHMASVAQRVNNKPPMQQEPKNPVEPPKQLNNYQKLKQKYIK